MPDGTPDSVDATAVTGAAAAWLTERADDAGVTEAEFLRRLVDAYRGVVDGDADADVPSAVDVAAVEAALADAEAEFDEKIEDVRERVVQVKREADAKAPADHDHAELAERTRAAAAATRRLEADHESLSADVDALAERTDAGFENFETVVSYLREETEDVAEKVTSVASAVVSLRESVAALAGAAARRERVERLWTAANRAGVAAADCGECGREVRVALLTEPNCPFCSAGFEAVEANHGWFGSHTLVPGEPPALTAGDAGVGDESWLDGDATLEKILDDRENGGDETSGDFGEDDETSDGPAETDAGPGDGTTEDAAGMAGDEAAAADGGGERGDRPDGVEDA